LWASSASSFYVDEAGKAPAFSCAGWKDRANNVPADPQALFKIGSLSKLYVATAAAKLVNDKILSLDGTLADYLPELARRHRLMPARAWVWSWTSRQISNRAPTMATPIQIICWLAVF